MAMANETDVQHLIAEGTGALRKGDKATARALLTRALEQDDRNEQVWLWLSGAVDTPEEQRICLENVLVLNPANDIARRGLDLLNQQTAQPPAPPPLTPLAAAAPPPAAPSAPAPPVVATSPPAATPVWATAPPAWAAPPPAAPPAAPPPPLQDSIFGAVPAVSDSVLPTWMDQPGGELATPAPPSAPSLPPTGSIFGMAPASSDTILPGWMDQPAGYDAMAAAPEPPPPPMVGGAAAHWSNVVNSLRSTEAFQAPPDPDPDEAPPLPSYEGMSGYAPSAPDAVPSWATAAQAAAPPSGTWVPPTHNVGASDPALQGIQPFQVPTEINSPAPPVAGDPFGGLFTAPPTAPPPAPPSYPPNPSTETPAGYEGYVTAPPQGSYDPNLYAGNDTTYQMPDSASAFHFTGTDQYGAGEYTSPDGPGLLGDLVGYDEAGHSYGSSPTLIGRPPLNRTAVTPTIPCPNCGELVTESALSCPRCNYRFYAPCPNCGEYIDTGDPSTAGKDVCPRCATPVDKLALGRSGVRVAGRGTNPREAMLAATRAQKTQKDLTPAQAPAEVKPRRRSSGAAVLLLLLIVLVIAVLIAYQMQIAPIYGLLQPLLSGATPVPTP